MKLTAKITLAIGILCLFAFAQTKPKAAVYIMGNPEGRDALKMAVNNFLIKSQKYQMIAVDAIDVVAKEQKRQKSGSVTDGDIALLGRDAGAEYVCVVERTELDGISYVASRMVSVQSKVAELADMTELPRGGKIIELIEWQIGSMLGMPVGPRPKADASAQSVYVAPTQSAPTVRTEPAIQGTIVPGSTLADKLDWLNRRADSHNTYILEVNADENIAPYTFEYKGAINITVVLRGVGGNRIIKLKSNGTMFTVKQNVTFILDNNITLMGHKGNSGSMVYVHEGIFTMTDGTISGNIAKQGGGVSVYGGTFTMLGGIISGNTASEGGGVYVDGGGVWVNKKGTFIMNGGTISGNIAKKGGGVYATRADFTIKNGIITNNTASQYGGGIMFTTTLTKFSKTGGTITGYNSDQNNGNVVKDEDGIIARRGHAVSCDNANKRKETTADPKVKLSSEGSCKGDWDE